MFDIKENLKNLPDTPGVYLHKDRLGNIIYVGKAVSLRNRVRQYFQSTKNMAPKVRSMVSQIAEFEYITAGSETEALILECNLIKKYRPKYNILLRDDKTYPYIKITNEEYPRIIKTRIVKKDGSRYFGPYSDAGAVNKIVDLLNASFALKRCSATSFPPGFRPCLNYHINQCKGVCSGEVDRQAYMESIEGAREFLNGKNSKILGRLKERMLEASEALNFEEAAQYRDYIEAAKALSATQRVVMHQAADIDIVIPARGQEEVHMVIFFVREGKLVGRETYEMESSWGENKQELVAAFLNQQRSILRFFCIAIKGKQAGTSRQHHRPVGVPAIQVFHPGIASCSHNKNQNFHRIILHASNCFYPRYYKDAQKNTASFLLERTVFLCGL